jgi:hypothetical protein
MQLSQSFRKIVWTQHSEIKMKQYGLSKSKLLVILRRPERKEQGIVPGTTAVMKTNQAKILFKTKQVTLKDAWKNSSAVQKKAPGEIWIMYKDVKRQAEGQIRKVISAWRYPGVTKPGEQVPVPEEIRQYIENSKNVF